MFFLLYKKKFHISLGFRGVTLEDEQAIIDLQSGLILALFLIYIILALVFNSYGMPILVMMVIPLGITGAILGHWVLGIDLQTTSILGMFGLSGIVINDVIILVKRYLELKKVGTELKMAIIDSTCQRFRPVLITSITTIAGLTPLMLATSYQAKFLIPMAVSLAFGLAYATILILFLVPALLYIFETHRWSFKD